MLQEFVTTNREAIISKARAKLTARPWPSATANELNNGVPLFLSQLSDTLTAESTGAPFSAAAISATATRHGRDLLGLGFTVSQVVHDYGDICQAVTELALEQDAPITTDEFHTLNRCLDTAIAEAVTEHARLTAETRSSQEAERLGSQAHEARDLVDTALLAFGTLKRGTVAINGSTGLVLGRTLVSLRELADATLTSIRIAANAHRHDPIQVTAFLDEIAAAATLHAEYRGMQFVIEPLEDDLTITGDAQLLASAVTNLVGNAFKCTRAGGRVVLRARGQDGRFLIEVEDECGGLPASAGDPFTGTQGDGEKSSIGLSIARKAIIAHGGDIRVQNKPGQGCVFIIDIPTAVIPKATLNAK
jgi:signal transduction histidine kinase